MSNLFMADCEEGKSSALIWEFGHVLVEGNLKPLSQLQVAADFS